MIEFNCASCGKVISAGEEQAGQQCSCPYCSVVQVVPQAGGSGAPPPPPQGQGMPQAPGPYAGAAATQAESAGGKGLAITALVLGLCSIVFSVLTGIPAVILGIISLAKGRGGKGMAIAGLICGVVLSIIHLTLMISITLPALTHAKQRAFQAKCMANLRGIGNSVALYQAENDDQYPGDLHTLFESAGLPQKMLKCPAVESGRECDYFYRSPAVGGDIGSLSSILACDFKDNHPDGRSVLRCDGSIVWMNEERFQSQLAVPENAAFAKALREAEAGMR